MKKITIAITMLLVSFSCFALTEAQTKRLEKTYNMYSINNEEYWSSIPFFQGELTENEAKEYIADLLEASTMLDKFAVKFMAEYDENTDYITEATEIQIFTIQHFARRYVEYQEAVENAEIILSGFLKVAIAACALAEDFCRRQAQVYNMYMY